MNLNSKLGAWLVIVLAYASGTAAWGQLATSFTYQGKLLENGSPANGIYDLTFTLYDAPTGGSPAGQAVSVQDVPITNGLFSVELNFGGGPFDNSDRWLDIRVDGTALTPRQPITGAPYSIETRGVHVNNDASFVGIGRDYPIGMEYFGIHAPIQSGYGGMQVSTDGQNAWPFYGYSAGGDFAEAWHFYDGETRKWHLFNGGNRLTVTNDGDVGVGIASPDSRLHVANGSAGVAPLASAQLVVERAANNYINLLTPDDSESGIFFGNPTSAAAGGIVFNDPITPDGLQFRNNGNEIQMVINSSGFVGIGRTTPLDEDDVLVLYRNTGANEWGGMQIETDNGSNPYYAYATGGVTDAYHYLDGTTGSWHLFNDGGVRLTVQDDGDVGIGTTDPDFRLHIEDQGGASLYAVNTGIYGWGVFAATTSEDGLGLVVVNSEGGSAAQFNGDVTVIGNLTKSSGSFKIDHPLDPENKFLFHSYVESPDMMNIYNGNVVTDENGFATVEMPEWFQALNREFRYQLTVIDEQGSDDFVLAKVVQEIRHNQFRIRTSAPNTKVSWLVTGVRQDAWAVANRIQVEVDKNGNEIGRYLHPEVFGHGPEMSIEAERQEMVNATREVGSDEALAEMEGER